MVTSYVDFQEQVGMSHRIEPKLFVWVSNINDMKWTLIQVNSPSKIQAGNLVVLKGVSIYLLNCTITQTKSCISLGVLFYFNNPTDDESIGFQISIMNSTAEFRNIQTTGDKLYPKGHKEKWMEPLTWKPIHVQHKLLLIPYYSF